MLEIDGNYINYEVVGTGVPILTIHGFWVDHYIMKGFIEQIIPTDKYKIIYFDLPGMGKTIVKEQLYHAEDMCDIIKKIVNRIIGNEKHIVIGESYGAYLMQKLINDDNNILGAMFLCPVVIPEYTKRDIPEKEIICDEIKDVKTKETENYKAFINMAVLSNMEILKRYEESILAGVNNANKDFLEIYQKNGYGFKEHSNKRFENPVLFVMGKQDHIVGYNDAYNILINYPRSSFCILDESGHNLQIEKPEIIKVLMEDWLERIKRNSASATLHSPVVNSDLTKVKK
jgi:pimeloyl-ACP methyl ester carboxylesterase